MLRLESALVVPVPAAEPCVGAHRRRHDPSARHGIPAHVTVLCPFVSPPEIDDRVTAAVRALFASRAPFRVTFAETRRFPDTLYLAPEPAAPFRELTTMLVAAYPEHPPYGGAFAEIIPHLTVAHRIEPPVLDEVDADVCRRLPIHTEVREAFLMVGETENGICAGPWRVIERFPLGPATG